MDIRPDMISSSSTESIIYDCRAQLMMIVEVVAWKFFNNDNDYFNLLCRRIINPIFNQKSLKSSTHVVFVTGEHETEDDGNFPLDPNEELNIWQ